MEWTVFGPVPQDRQEEVRNNLLAGKSPAGLSPVQTRGGNLYFRTRAGAGSLFPKTKPGNTAWAETTFHSPVEGTMHAMVGFDAPARSTRRCSGVPAAGEWSQCGTRIWVNGKEMKNPQTYKLAGQRRYEKHTWNSPANEIPFDNEEILVGPASCSLSSEGRRKQDPDRTTVHRRISVVGSQLHSGEKSGRPLDCRSRLLCQTRERETG